MRNVTTALALAAIAAFSGCSNSEDPGSSRNAPLRPLGGGGPDLILTSLTVTAQTANSISYSWTIRNIGDAPANLDGPTSSETDNVSVQAFLSQDTVFGDAGDSPAGGTILGLSPLGFLNPGESVSGSFSSGTFQDPCSFAYLTLKADWGESVAEVNEANNTLATPIGCGPDLILTELTVTSVSATSISYSWTIQNIGSAPADLEGPTSATHDNVSVQAFLSQDTIFNNAGDVAAGGTVVGISPIGVLNPGESRSGSFSSTPSQDPCGFAYLVLMVDWGGVVDESDETNNTRAASIDCCPEMEIDIKPGSDVNRINPKSKGVIPVAILGSADLDVHDIDQSTIAFGPSAMDTHKQGGHFEDVNGDGYVDLVLHFPTQETGIQSGDTEACLTADLNDGCSLSACDNIRTVPTPGMSGP